jgi:lipoprotein-anchoring transpeptidase ErfK/SrfK
MRNPNFLGAAVVLLVKSAEDGWVQAYVPFRPNGSTAWVRGADVSLSLDAVHIAVSLGSRHLTLYKGNGAVFETAVAPGAPTSPTPTGLFFVTYVVRLSDPGSAYGPYALVLSGFSNTYFSFDGGPGQVAIHGTNQPWEIGQYASHGCVRVPNAAVTALAAQVPQGTPVVIAS